MRTHPQDRGPCSRVELILSAKALADRDVFSKSDPICMVEELIPWGQRSHAMQMKFVEIGRTERIKNSLSPQWSTKIHVNYFFESKQLLRFNIYDIDSDSAKLSDHDFLGFCECELADIVTASDGTLSLRVNYIKKFPNQNGMFTVCAEEMDVQRESLRILCHGIGLKQSRSPLCACMGGSRKTFLELHRLIDDDESIMVHRTEKAKAKRNPKWKPFDVMLKHLCASDKDSQFVIKCYEAKESGKHHHIGSACTSVNELLAAPMGQQLELVRGGQKGSTKLTGILHIVEVRLQREYTFLDYISRGMQLEFAVSVDLTASNGEVYKPSSLHFVNSQYLNQYECAISAVLEICEHYNQSKQFEALGFGAEIPPTFGESFMFPLRLNNFERFVPGMQGVLNAYRFAIVNTRLSGPTNFAPTIREFVHKTSQFPRNGTRYQVLLILTDGEISDMRKTIRAIIEASHQPISIIIIGIGNDSFDMMDQLDSDNVRLSIDGHTAVRDIVQFVPFYKFTGGSWAQSATEQAYLKSMLAKEVLAELPYQVCAYMKAHNIPPPHAPPLQETQ